MNKSLYDSSKYSSQNNWPLSYEQTNEIQKRAIFRPEWRTEYDRIHLFWYYFEPLFESSAIEYWQEMYQMAIYEREYEEQYLGSPWTDEIYKTLT